MPDVNGILQLGGVGTALLLAVRIAEPAVGRLIAQARASGGSQAAAAADRDDIRAQERTLSIVALIKETLDGSNQAHVAEMHGIRMAIETSATALTRLAERLENHHDVTLRHQEVTLPAAAAALETRTLVGEVKTIVERRRR